MERTLVDVGHRVEQEPPQGASYDKPMYEPFWAAAQVLDASISLHIDTNRPAPLVVAESNRSSRASVLANADYWVRVARGRLVLEGMFERYPRLCVGSAEHDFAWVPYFLDRIDYTYTQRLPRPLAPIPYRHGTERLLPPERLPELSGGRHGDPRSRGDRRRPPRLGIRLPHTESTFPHSRAILERILAGVPDEERRLITAANAARPYHFDSEALGEPATAARACR